jgi:hypothetical protein
MTALYQHAEGANSSQPSKGRKKLWLLKNLNFINAIHPILWTILVV